MTQMFAARALVRIPPVLTIALVLTLTAAPLSAQQDQPVDAGRVHLGPLALNPTIGWQTEFDNNVFRTANHPVEDYISTFGGKTDVRGRMGRVGLTASGAADWVHYANVRRERGANVSTMMRLDLLFNRIAPYASASYDNTRQRMNLELDPRPRVERLNVVGGSIVRFGAKTGLDVQAKRSIVTYAEDAFADDVNLSGALNRVSHHLMASFFAEPTSATRLVAGGEAFQDQFDPTSHRSADNARLIVGLDSDGRVITRARGGWRVLKPHDPAVPQSEGLFMSIHTIATVKDRLQIGVDAERDLEPSYRLSVTYYKYDFYSVSLGYALRRSLRLMSSAGYRAADYRLPVNGWTSAMDPAGIERELRYRFGVNYLLGNSLGLDLSGAFMERTSAVAGRQYKSLSLRAGINHAF